MSDTSFDVAVIGGGPAGLSAALWLARYLRRVVVIDGGDPRNWETRGINGYLGLPHITPPELRYRGREECRSYGVMFIDAKVEYVDRLDDETFKIDLENGMGIVVKRVLLTIGIIDEWPDIPGLDRCYGDTAHVCPDCDGYDTRQRKTVVVGSGRKAAGLALALTTWTDEIIICTHGEPADLKEEWLQKLQTLNIPVIESRIQCAHSAHGEVTGLDLEDGMSLDCEQLFFSIGQEASDDLGAQLGCARDSIGRIVVDRHYHTSVANIYAAGDVTPSPQLAIVAAAEGAVAALAIHHSLLPAVQQL